MGKKKTEERSRGTRETSPASTGGDQCIATKPKLKDSLHKFLSKVPKMAPFFQSKGDTMDAFKFRFEMLVKSCDWSDETKFFALSNLLTGESLRVLQSLSLEQLNYSFLPILFV